MPIVAAIAVPHPPIILPEIGKGEEAAIAKTDAAYRDAMRFLAGFAPETVVIISPHADMYADGFQISPGDDAFGDFARFGAPRIEVEATYDAMLASAVEVEAGKLGIAATTAGEKNRELDHGTTIPLVYLARACPACKVVRIGLSGLPLADHYRLGQAIAAATFDKPVAVIGSGDLSHKLKEDGPYGYAPEGPKLDAQICTALETGDFGALMDISPTLAEKGAECGLRSFVVMAGALDARPVQASLLSYEGPFGVGYAVATFRPDDEGEHHRFAKQAETDKRREMVKRQAEEDAYVSLARYSMEAFVNTGRRAAMPGALPEDLRGRKAGVFVSLHLNGALRGCIGTIAATTGSVAEEIMQNAVSAASEDPRFAPVRPDELDLLEVKVDVLGEAEPIASPAELNPQRYGVIVRNGGRRGLLLPELEGVDTAEQQVAIARQKAGIAEGEALELQRFEVVRHT